MQMVRSPKKIAQFVHKVEDQLGKAQISGPLLSLEKKVLYNNVSISET